MQVVSVFCLFLLKMFLLFASLVYSFEVVEFNMVAKIRYPKGPKELIVVMVLGLHY